MDIVGRVVFYREDSGEGPSGFDAGAWVPLRDDLASVVLSMMQSRPESVLVIEPREEAPSWARGELMHSDGCTCPMSITKHSIVCPLYKEK